jgi:hypothetical protein
MIEALTGVRCFDGPLFDALAARLAASPEVPATLPEPWPGLLRAMTDMEPARRPTAAQVAAAFAAAPTPLLSDVLLPASAMSVEAPPPVRADPADSDWYPVPDRPRRGLWLALAVLAFVAILAGGGYFLFAGHASTPTDGPGGTPLRQVSAPAAKHRSPTAGPSGATQAVQPVRHPRAHRSHSAAATRPAGHATASPTSSAPAAPTTTAGSTPSSPPPTPTPSSSPAVPTSPPATP